jgi:hypothetical protein
MSSFLEQSLQNIIIDSSTENLPDQNSPTIATQNIAVWGKGQTVNLG